VGSVTESYPQSADPVAPPQCQWQMAEGRQRDSLLPTSSESERTHETTELQVSASGKCVSYSCMWPALVLVA
jgi:hypothetical protein